MAIEIKSIDGKVLYTAAEHVRDVRAALQEAVEAHMDLHGAYLGGAALRGADFGGAYLHGAYFVGANLRGADFGGAALHGAQGINPRRVNDLLILLDQPGRVWAYKLVDHEYRSPIQSTSKLTYRVGDSHSEPNANTDATVQCAKGINVATLSWCVAHWYEGYRIMVVEFSAKDIAAIPSGDGKFRVRKCRVVGEKDLVEIGLVEAGAAA